MTLGEKFVFAAAFVREMEKHREFVDYGSLEHYKEQEIDAAASAVENATSYVEWLRDARDPFEEGWGVDHPGLAMLDAMLEKEGGE